MGVPPNHQFYPFLIGFFHAINRIPGLSLALREAELGRGGSFGSSKNWGMTTLNIACHKLLYIYIYNLIKFSFNLFS